MQKNTTIILGKEKMFVGKQNHVHVLYALKVNDVAFNRWRPSFLVMIEV